MLTNQRALSLVVNTNTNTNTNNNLQDEDHNHHHHQDDESPMMRDIHALTPPRAPRAPHSEAWDATSRRSSSLSTMASSENFSTMSREFNALVLAGSTVGTAGTDHESALSNLERIGEDDLHHETNPLAIVLDNNLLDPVQSPRAGSAGSVNDALVNTARNDNYDRGEVSLQRVKKEEVESRINAWQNAKIAKVNNRFKREDAVISGLEGEQVQKASSRMKKVERKLEEKRAKALEKMQNDIAKARRKAEEKRATTEAKRGTKVAGILEIVNVMRAVGRPPVKRSFF